MRRGLIAFSALLLPLTACGGGNDKSDKDVVEQGTPRASASGSAGDSVPDAEAGQLVDYGFGQNGQYAGAMAVVKNTSDHGGQTVTVSVNFLDKSGEIITTENQVESFAYAGQTIALQVWADLGSPRTKADSIEPTLLVEDEDTFGESDIHLDPVEASKITQHYGQWEAAFPIVNPGGDPLQELRVGVVCKDGAGKIIGGTAEYPDLVPPNGQIVMTTNSLTVSEKPDNCTAYPSPSTF